MAEPRAKDREAAVLLRMSKETKAELVDEAKFLGISVQVLLERRLLGLEDAQPRSAGPIPHRLKDEELFPMTG